MNRWFSRASADASIHPTATKSESMLTPSTRARRHPFLLSLPLAVAALSLNGVACNKSSAVDVTPVDAPSVKLVELPGVDSASLIQREKEIFSKIVTSYNSPCGEPVTLAVCVEEHRACNKCVPAAKAVAKMVPRGMPEQEIRDWLDLRFDDRSVKSIDVAGSPSIGPADAPLQITEFADFECPHCKAMRPVLHTLLDEPAFKGKIRLVFKEFPLQFHEHADPAARAVLAAQAQGKFWELHDLLFENQETLTQPDIERFARQAGLDVEKFRIDQASPEVKARVAADRDLGTKIGVTGTPAIFINGRKFTPNGNDSAYDQVLEWLRLDLALLGQAPAASSGSAAGPPTTARSAAPSSATSAAPSASPSAKTSR